MAEKEYVIKSKYLRDGRVEVLEEDVPGCEYAQELVAHYKEAHGEEFSIWMEEQS